MHRLKYVLYFVLIIAAMIMMVAFGYYLGQKRYTDRGISFEKKNNILKVNVSDYCITITEDKSAFFLSKYEPDRTLPTLILSETRVSDVIELIFYGFSEGMCTTEKNIISKEIGPITFSYNPSPRTHYLGNSSYIDEDGDGTFDCWLLHLDRGALPNRTKCFRLKNVPPYFEDMQSENHSTNDVNTLINQDTSK